MSPAQNPPRTIEASMFTLRILYVALLACVGIYGFISYVLAAQPGPNAPAPVLLYALIGVAAATTVVLPVLRGRLLPPTRSPSSLAESATTGPLGEAGGRAAGRYFTACIISWALSESIAIDGLILVQLSHQLVHYLGFAAGALVNFALYRPSADFLAGAVRAAESQETDSNRIDSKSI
jgi:hypothetical protein